MASLRADSTQYLTSAVLTDHDPAASTVEVALPPAGQAVTSWYAATVLGTVEYGSRWRTTYRLLVGPAGGAVTLTPAQYDWVVRVADSEGPEVAVLKAPGGVTITAT